MISKTAENTRTQRVLCVFDDFITDIIISRITDRVLPYVYTMYAHSVRNLFYSQTNTSLIVCRARPVLYSADHSARGGHLRVGHRTDRRSGHHSPAGPGGRGRGRVVLADGLQEDAERERAPATSDPGA